MKIELDMYQTMAVAVLVLMLGKFLKKRVNFLERFCIPAPVIGGVIFAVFTCICYVTGVAEFTFDDILKEVCMVFFFTSDRCRKRTSSSRIACIMYSAIFRHSGFSCFTSNTIKRLATSSKESTMSSISFVIS